MDIGGYFPDFSFGVRRGGFYQILADSIFTQEGKSWKHSGELLRKQFAWTQYQKFDLLHEHVGDLLARLPKERGVVDLQPHLYRLTLYSPLKFKRACSTVHRFVENYVEQQDFKSL